MESIMLERYHNDDRLIEKYDPIQECIKYAQQIKLHDPDPYYVKYCFAKYLKSVDVAINDIFATADIDFGLFASKPVTRDSFADCIRQKYDKNRDTLASQFLQWYDIQYAGQWHSGTYPYMMRLAHHTFHITEKVPEIKIMLRAKNRYKDDPTCDMNMDGLTSNGKLRSKDELSIQLNRYTPIFLDVINYKRSQRGEPRVSEKQVVASAFAIIDTGFVSNVVDVVNDDDVVNDNDDNNNNHNDNIPIMTASSLIHSPRTLQMEIGHAAELYTHVIKRMRSESSTRVKNLIASLTTHTAAAAL